MMHADFKIDTRKIIIVKCYSVAIIQKFPVPASFKFTIDVKRIIYHKNFSISILFKC